MTVRELRARLFEQNQDAQVIVKDNVLCCEVFASRVDVGTYTFQNVTVPLRPTFHPDSDETYNPGLAVLLT